ncbi:MAG: hypothetical protein Q8Q05_01810 [bacterium]|nr:hypothetical protein [bacterium]
MKTTIIKIGNSRGIRIPKLILEESGLGDNIELLAKRGEIRIIPDKLKTKSIPDTALASEKSLGRDWNRPEEDKAWANLLPVR